MTRLSPKLKVPQKVRSRRFIRFFKKTFWIVLILVLVWQLFKLNSVLSKTTTAILNETVAQTDELQKELDEIREYLLMPPSSDSFPENDSQSIEQLFDEMLFDYQNTQQEQEFKNLINQKFDSKFQELDMQGYNLVMVDEPLVYTFQKDNEAILEFSLSNSQIKLNTPSKNKTYKWEDSQAFINDLNNLLNLQNLNILTLQIKVAQNAHAELQEFVNNPPSSIQQLLQDKHLTITFTPDSKHEIQATTEDNSVVFSITYDLINQQFVFNQSNKEEQPIKTSSLQQLAPNIVDFLSANNFPTLIQKNVKDKLSLLNQTLGTEDFKSHLKQLNLSLKPYQDTDFYYIDFVNRSTSKVVIQLKLNKETAEITKTMGDQEPEIVSFLNSTPAQPSYNSNAYLLAGTHGRLTDTLMLVNINEATQNINLLSIPRDLYIQGQKINAVYAKSGMEGLKKTVESISGIHINKYVLMDMYDFIDVIDYLGGIEIYLDRPVSDPSYKTFDNGQWGTMYFAAGYHKLNGTQALRLARSRYTSSDFARASRQQQILAAVKEHILNLGFKDVKAISQIAATIISKTETDLSIPQAITTFFKYKNYTINNQTVLSTQNILTSTYSNEFNEISCEDCGKGAYILVPHNNDWSLLRTYIVSHL